METDLHARARAAWVGSGPRPPMIAGLTLAAAGAALLATTGNATATIEAGSVLLGSLFSSGHDLRVPLLTATAGYLVAVILAWSAVGRGERTML